MSPLHIAKDPEEDLALMAYSDITLPEVGRRLDSISADLRAFASAHVPSGVYQVEVQTLRDQAAAAAATHARDVADLRAELAVERNARLTAERERAAADMARDAADKERSERMRLAVIAAASSAILSPIGAIVVTAVMS